VIRAARMLEGSPMDGMPSSRLRTRASAGERPSTLAAVIIAEALAEEAPAAAAAEVINDTWAQQSFPWRMVRLAS
jgi:hypothetical protein